MIGTIGGPNHPARRARLGRTRVGSAIAFMNRDIITRPTIAGHNGNKVFGNGITAGDHDKGGGGTLLRITLFGTIGRPKHIGGLAQLSRTRLRIAIAFMDRHIIAPTRSVGCLLVGFIFHRSGHHPHEAITTTMIAATRSILRRRKKTYKEHYQER